MPITRFAMMADLTLDNWRLVITDRPRWDYLIKKFKASRDAINFRLELYGDRVDDLIELRRIYVAERRKRGRTFATVAFRAGWLHAEEMIEIHGVKE